MIYYESQINYWSAASHDVMVVPVDCSGEVQPGPLTVLNTRFPGLEDRYRALSRGNHLTTGVIKFDWRGSGGSVKWVILLPLAPNRAVSYGMKAWVDCMEDLSAKLHVLCNVTSIGIPYLPAVGDWGPQETTILNEFEELSEKVMDVWLYPGTSLIGEEDEIDG